MQPLAAAPPAAMGKTVWTRQDGGMISDDLARALEATGLRWHPEPGDQFRIKNADFADVFILSHMVIEPRTYDTGTVLNFNGTTEWALDNISQDDALWLPREDQLRAMLGNTFRGLRRVEDEYELATTRADGSEQVHRAPQAAEAYGQALLELLDRVFA